MKLVTSGKFCDAADPQGEGVFLKVRGSRNQKPAEANAKASLRLVRMWSSDWKSAD
jgi:hypothetical protein